MTTTNSYLAEAKVINRTLLSYGIEAGIPLRKGGSIVPTPGYVIYRVVRMPWVRVSDVTNLLPEVTEAITMMRGDTTLVRFNTNPLCVEVPKINPGVLDYAKANVDPLPPLSLVTGRSYLYGKPKEHVLSLPDSSHSHIFVAGQTGSGKTTLLQSMVLSVSYSTSPEELYIYLVDLKNAGLVPLQNLPHVRVFVSDDYGAGVVIQHVFIEMMKRNRERSSPEPRHLLVIDDMRELRFSGEDILDAWLSRIVSMGRERGVHVLAATQKSLASELGPIVNSQFPVRIAGVVSDANESRHAIKRKGAGAELLPGKGAFLLNVHGSPLTRIQGYMVSESNIDAQVERVRLKWPDKFAPPFDEKTEEDETEVLLEALEKEKKENEIERYADQAKPVFDQYWDGAELKRGGLAAIVRSIYGPTANTGGANRDMALRVIEHIKSQLGEATTWVTNT